MECAGDLAQSELLDSKSFDPAESVRIYSERSVQPLAGNAYRKNGTCLTFFRTLDGGD